MRWPTHRARAPPNSLDVAALVSTCRLVGGACVYLFDVLSCSQYLANHFQELFPMQIMFINNDGGGFADRIVVRDTLTVRELFADKMGGASTRDYLIRVNRQPAESDQLLKENDRVSFTPTKIEGACSAAVPSQPVQIEPAAFDEGEHNAPELAAADDDDGELELIGVDTSSTHLSHMA